MSREYSTLLKLLTFTFAAILSFGTAAKDFSSAQKFTKGELVSDTTALVPGSLGSLGFHVTLEDKWHTYWVNPGDSGAPVRLDFRTSKGIKLKSVSFPMPERMQTGPLVSFGYSKEVLIPIEVQVSKDLHPGETVWVEADVEWLVCAEVCIPAVETFHADFPIAAVEDVKPSPFFELFQKARSLVPVESKAPAFVIQGDKVQLPLPEWNANEEFVDFFPFKASGVSNIQAKWVEGQPPFLEFEKSNLAQVSADRIGVLVTRVKDNGRLTIRQFGDSGWKYTMASSMDMSQFWWMLISAFIGGLILNRMPCVFPILSMKLLSLLKYAAHHPREVRQQNFAYVVGVLVSFISIALLLSVLRSAGSLVGWGFQLQSPIFVILLVWLFFLLALNLLGLFEIDILNAGFGHRLTRLGGLWGSFFTGILAVVVASPCTAPFMGVALGFGLAQPTYVLLAIFGMLGLGLSFPYLVFAIFPAFVRLLPKPGTWMVRLKKIMAIPLFGTMLWLMWILSQVKGPAAAGVAFAGCALIAVSIVMHMREIRIATALALFAGMFYVGSLRPAVSNLADGMWRPYSESLLRELKEDRNVLVDMTADWCLTCKVNERLVLNDSEIQALFKERKVELLKGDWTQRNEEITRFLNRYDRVGVPFYVLFSARHPNGLPLPEVLTKSTFKEIITREFP